MGDFLKKQFSLKNTMVMNKNKALPPKRDFKQDDV